MREAQKETFEEAVFPSTWTTQTLGSIVDVRGRIGWRGLTREDYREDGPLFIAVNNITRDFSLDLTDITRISEERYEESPEIMIQTDDILLAKSGTIGRACFIENLRERATVNAAVNILRCKNGVVPKFMFYFLTWEKTQRRLFQMSNAGAQPNLFQRDTRKLPVILPTIQEQQKIASILSKVDELIQKTDQVIKQTQRLKKGLMQKLLTKGVGHSKFKKTPIGEIPEEWDTKKLGEALGICQYGISEKISLHGQYPIFRMNNIEGGNLQSNEMKFIDLDKSVFEQYKLEKGDLLFNRTNSADLVGKVGLFNLDGDYTFASYLIRLRTIKEVMNPFFLHLYLNTDWMQYMLKSIATPGVGQVNINATNLKSITVPFPPISEQEDIVSILLGLERKMKNEKMKKVIIEKLKKGLMQKLLTGKIRVKI